MPTPSQAHCASCHHTFAGVTGFDAHRKAGRCVHPATLGMVEVNRVWRRVETRRPAHWIGQDRSTGDAA